jgi:hypothetical protein
MHTNSYKSTILNHNSCYGLTLLFPHPLPAVWSKSVDFCFIWLDNLLPILTVYSLYFKAKSKCCFWWRIDSNGFFFFTIVVILRFLGTLQIVWFDTGLLIMLLRFLATSTTFLAFLMLIWLMIVFSFVGVSFFGLPPLRFSLLGLTFFASLEIVALLQPSLEAMWP